MEVQSGEDDPMKATVDRDLCAGCAVCVDECPEVFDMDDQDIATVKVDVVPEDEEDACRDAAENCPSEAIIIAE